jgi:hypothetical protein
VVSITDLERIDYGDHAMKINACQAINTSPVYGGGRQSERNERPMQRVKPLASVSHPRYLKTGTTVVATLHAGRATRTNIGVVVSMKDRYRLGV